LNWADFSQPVNELDQNADHPALSPSLAILDGEKKRQIILADLAPPRGKPAENTCHKSSGGVTSGEKFGLAHFSNGLWFFDDFSKLT
jgi:hypothetical protein